MRAPSFLLAVLLGGGVAHAQDAEPAWRGTDAETSVAAAMEWLMLRALSDALVDRLDVAPEGDGTLAGIGFASTRLAARYDDAEAGDRLARVAQVLVAVRGEGGAPATEGDAFAVACIANGADPAAGRAFAERNGFEPALYDGCGPADLDTQTEAWDVALSGALLFEGEPPAEVPVEVEGEGASADWLTGTGLVEGFADEAASTSAFIDPLPVTVRSCSAPGVRYAPGEGVSVCTETVDLLAGAALAAEAEAGDGEDAEGAEGTGVSAPAEGDDPTDGG